MDPRARTPRAASAAAAAITPSTLAVVLVFLAMATLAAGTAAAAPAARTRDLGDAKTEGGAAATGGLTGAGQAGDSRLHRVRRQNGEVVESIFQIPIQTLMAVSKVFTTGIQSVQRMREQFFQATRPTGSGGGSSAVYNYQQQQLQQLQQLQKPNRPYKPFAGGAGGAGGGGSSSSAYSSAFASLNRPAYYPGYVLYNYNRPRSGAAQPPRQQSHAASVAGVAAQGDGSSYRI